MPYLKTLGYESHLSGGDPTFILRDSEIVVHFFFGFPMTENIERSPLMITHYSVEDYILEVGIPSNNFELYNKRGKYHLPTIELRGSVNPFKRRSLNTVRDVEAYADYFIEFYKKEGAAFIDKYDSLPMILSKMNDLRERGEYWHGILSGGPEHLVKGLIISKLCEDPHYQEKYDWVVPLLIEIEEWKPYWEKYNQVLTDIEPRYSPIVPPV